MAVATEGAAKVTEGLQTAARRAPRVGRERARGLHSVTGAACAPRTGRGGNTARESFKLQREATTSRAPTTRRRRLVGGSPAVPTGPTFGVLSVAVVVALVPGTGGRLGAASWPR